MTSIMDLIKPRNPTPTKPTDVRGVQDLGAGNWSVAPSLLADMTLTECRALFGAQYYPLHMGASDAHAWERCSSSNVDQGGTVKIR